MLIDAAHLPPVLPLRVTMRAAEAQLVPAFAGSALHGALGRALWKTVCAFPRRRECAGCPLFNRCAYPALFASCAPTIEGLEQVGIREQAPRPMVLAPEPGWTLPSGHPRLIAQGAENPLPRHPDWAGNRRPAAAGGRAAADGAGRNRLAAASGG